MHSLYVVTQPKHAHNTQFNSVLSKTFVHLVEFDGLERRLLTKRTLLSIRHSRVFIRGQKTVKPVENKTK